MFLDSIRLRQFLIGMVLMACLLGTTTARSPGGAEQEEAARLYQEGYGLILQGQFEAGRDVLSQVIGRFPDSDWAVDSRFWICHAEEKSGADARASFACFEEFALNFEGSRYFDDAQARMIEHGQRLAQQGDDEYAGKVRALRESQQEEISLMALRALADIGDEEALQTLMSLYNTDLSEEVRSRIVHMLEDFESPEARSQLIEIARSEPSLEVRRSAIRTLGDMEWDESLSQFMRELAVNGEPAEVRLYALRAFGDQENSEWIPMLVEVASTTEDEEVGRAALNAIEDIGGESAGEAARSVYRSAAAAGIRRRALYMLAETGGDAALAELERIALEAPDEESRRSALRAIGDIESQAAFDTLSRLATDSADPRTREAAVNSLEDFEADQVVTVLIQVLSSDSSPDVRRRAALTLGDIESDAAIGPLKNAAMNDSHAGVKRAAIDALGDIGSAAARQALTELLNRP